MYSYMSTVFVVGMKREMETDEEEKHNDGEESTPMLKRRRGEGPHVELRILLASKVPDALMTHNCDDLFL